MSQIRSDGDLRHCLSPFCEGEGQSFGAGLQTCIEISDNARAGKLAAGVFIGGAMSATLIFGVDFKNKAPKAERIFTLGPEGEVSSKVVEIENVQLVDTTPSEYCAPENDPA